MVIRIFSTLIALCFALTSQASSLSKLSPWLQIKMAKEKTTAAHRAAASQPVVTYVPVFVESENGELPIRSHGGVIYDYLEPAYVALVPMERLAEMAADAAIKCIEANEPMEAKLDTTVKITNISDVWAGQKAGMTALPQAYTGKGVVAAMVDAGIDFTHPMLRTEDGKSRFTWFLDTWIPSDTGGIGTVYDTPEKILEKGKTNIVQQMPHGMHVAGIMAGSQFGAARGIAYEAELMGAELNNTAMTKAVEDYLRQQFADDPQAVNRIVSVEKTDVLVYPIIKTIYERAEAQGKPCVINFSYGSRTFHLKSFSLTSRVLSHIVGPDHPGRVFVVASGNEGHLDIFREKQKDQPLDLTWKSPSSNQVFLVRFPANESDFTIKISEQKKGLVAEVKSSDILKAYKTWDSQTNPDQLPTYEISNDKVAYTLTYLDQLSKAENYHVFLMDVALPGLEDVVFNYTLSCESPVSLELSLLGGSTFSDTPINQMTGRSLHTISQPGSFESAIAVGATHYRMMVKNVNGEMVTNVLMGSKPGQLAALSSCGPTIDGRIKPDVVAPGTSIYSAVPSVIADEKLNSLITYEEERFGKKHALAAFSGTSMAAPHVAGIVALWLQANPKLTQDDVKTIISKTSHQLEEQFTEKNNYYGWGQIDAYAGLLEALHLATAIPTLSQHQPEDITFRVADGRLYAEGAEDGTTVTLYNLSGVAVRQGVIDGGSVSLAGLQRGVYAVQIGKQGSTLIRLSSNQM